MIEGIAHQILNVSEQRGMDGVSIMSKEMYNLY